MTKLITRGIAITQDENGNCRLKFEPDAGILVQRLELSIDATNQVPLLKLTLVPGQLDALIESFGLIAEEVKEVGPDGVQRVFVLNDDKVRYFDKDGTPLPVPTVNRAGDLFQRQEPTDG